MDSSVAFDTIYLIMTYETQGSLPVPHFYSFYKQHGQLKTDISKTFVRYFVLEPLAPTNAY